MNAARSMYVPIPVNYVPLSSVDSSCPDCCEYKCRCDRSACECLCFGCSTAGDDGYPVSRHCNSTGEDFRCCR